MAATFSPRYSVSTAALADENFSRTSSTTATFSARGFSIELLSSSGGSRPFQPEGTGCLRIGLTKLRCDEVVPQAVGVDLDARAHRAGQRDALQVAPLRRCRLGPLELVEDRPQGSPPGGRRGGR